MPTTLRDIAVFLDASSGGERIGTHAARIALEHDAHLIGIYGVTRDGAHATSEGFARGEHAIRELVERRRLQDEKNALAAGRRFAEFAREHNISSEFRLVWQDGPDDDAVLRALHCDLVVAAHPRPEGLPAGWSAERLLLTTGTPVLIVPQSWSYGEIGRNVIIAWNRSREARRAVNDAMPFIARAQTTTILTIDGEQDPDRFGEDPGANLAEHLRRHEVAAEVIHVSSEGVPVAEVIAREANERGADLLVFGAYSRSRTSELLFGGTTRTLLASHSIPLLVSN
ncbi:MAG: universal stress protein [Pseudodonghicola sp.]